MAEYVKIKNGEVAWRGACPKNTATISNFYLMNDDDKKKYGYYVLKPDGTTVEPWQEVVSVSYNIQDMGEKIYTLEFAQDPIIEYDEEGNTIEKPQDPIIETYSYQDYNITEVRNIQNVDLEILKKQKKDFLKLEFEELMKEGYTSSIGIKHDCQNEDILLWQGEIFAMQISQQTPTEITIRDYNNALHTITWEQFNQVYLELTNHFKTQFSKKWQYQNEVDALTNHQEVYEYQWVR